MSNQKSRAFFESLTVPPATPPVRKDEEPNGAGFESPRRLSERRNHLNEMASGTRQKKIYQLVKPERCRIWAPRQNEYAQLSEENCRDLIESLRRSSEQRTPAIVRKIEDDPDYEYEVICGNRRHWAILWLRQQQHYKLLFLVDIQELDDEEAFRLNVDENHARANFSRYQRALVYRQALEVQGYYKTPQEMADRLGIPLEQLEQLLALAELPEDPDVFGVSPGDGRIIRWVDPDRCRLWPRHNRLKLDFENCRDLIDSIDRNGQSVAAIGRAVRDDPDCDYEIIAGGRRFWAVKWLRDHAEPENREKYQILIDIRALDDREAFLVADLENKDRKDISDYERAKDYHRALSDFYRHGDKKKMAEALGIEYTSFTRLLDLAEMPEEIIKAFGSFHEVRIEHVRKLKPLYEHKESDIREKVFEMARVIQFEQDERRHRGHKLLEGAKIVSRLMSAATEASATRERVKFKVMSTGDRISINHKGVVLLELNMGRPVVNANLEEVLLACREIFETQIKNSQESEKSGPN